MITEPYEVNITKPLWENENGSWVCIYDRHIKSAIKNRQFLKITTPNNTEIVMPKFWRNNAKKMRKVFLIPTRPMLLYCNYVKTPKRKSEEERLKEFAKLGAFG